MIWIDTDVISTGSGHHISGDIFKSLDMTPKSVKKTGEYFSDLAPPGPAEHRSRFRAQI